MKVKFMDAIIPEGSTRAYDRTSYILIVDDDNTLLKFFKIHLNKFFSRIIVVKNAKEATDTMKEKEIDLVMSDLRMPRTDGLMLMKKIRKTDRSIPFLLISGALLSPEQETEVLEADGFLRKPFTVDELHDFINKGMDLREQLKKLHDLIDNKKKFNSLMNGEITPFDCGPKVDGEQVKKIMSELRRVS